MRETLDELVLRDKVPVLGVCVGMQILARSSDEGKLPGLGWIDADVQAFKSSDATRNMALPHMGWNDVRPCRRTGYSMKFRPMPVLFPAFLLLHELRSTVRTCSPSATMARISPVRCSPPTSTACSFIPKKVTVSGIVC